MAAIASLSADRLIEQALKAGVAALVADAALFARMLASYPADERARERARFLARTPSVQGAFARASDKFPLWSVVLGDEQADHEMIGDYLEVDATAGPYGSQVLGAIEGQAISVLIQCEHPDETRSHHLLAKSIIRGSALWLIGQGATEISYQGARDLSPQESYLPENIFARQQTWKVGGISVAYVPLPEPHTTVYVHPSGITVDGINGGVIPE